VLTVTELSPRLIVLTLGGDGVHTSYGANAVALAGARGTLLVDPLIAPAHARLLEGELRRRGFPRVAEVALTHHHTDHALGAGYFAEQGARVHAHSACAAAMAAQHPGLVAARRKDPTLAALFADARPHVPAALVDGPVELDLGGVRVRIVPLGHGHTAGDLAVHLPEEGVAMTGDVIFRGFHFNYEEADPAGAVGALGLLRALQARTFVPGHGAPGGPEVLDEQARYHADARRLLVGAASDEAAREALLGAYPAHLLAAAVGTAVEAFRKV